MADLYVPAPGVFVDGTVADAADFLNEYDAIATAFRLLRTEASQGSAQAIVDAGSNTDTKLQALTVDGGTF